MRAIHEEPPLRLYKTIIIAKVPGYWIQVEKTRIPKKQDPDPTFRNFVSQYSKLLEKNQAKPGLKCRSDL